MHPPVPANEARRLATLDSFNVLDTLPERDYDDITALAATITDTPISLVSLVDSKRQWFKSRHGLDAPETPREQAFCAHAICAPDQLFVVGDASADERFCDNPLVTGAPDIRFYAGAPLVTADGDAVGTLCVIDRKPRELTAAQQESLAILSRMVMAQLELRRNLAEMESAVLVQEEYVEALENQRERIERSHANLKITAVTDPLTGILNRRGLDRCLEDACRQARERGSVLSLIMLDVDYFKQFNDTFGHSAGDEVLRQMGALLKSATRDFDSAGRYGGEEFVLILPNTSEQGVIVLAERVRRIVQSAVWRHRQVTVSVGTATINATPGSAAALFEAADQALYAAKAAGRNCCRHSADLQAAACG